MAHPVAAALVAQLPAIAAGAMQLAVRTAGIGDRTGPRVDQDARPVAECGRQCDLDVPPHVDALGDTRGRNGCGKLFLFGRAACARRADQREPDGKRNVRLRGSAARDIEDDGRRALRAARPHGGAGTFSAAYDSTLAVSDNDGGVRAAAVDPKQDGRMGGWAAGPFGHAVPPICPSAHLPDASDEIIPTATVTAVPSGTYHGHASPGSQWTGKWGITAPRTTGAMTRMLTTSAMMTSTCRARGQAPPKM